MPLKLSFRILLLCFLLLLVGAGYWAAGIQPKDVSSRLNKGKQLYNANCSSCHNPLRLATGPPLALLDKRRDWNWLKAFIRNSAALIASGDAKAVFIYEYYGKTAMTPFPTLTDEQCRLIFEYADYMARNTPVNSISDPMKSLDSCMLFNIATGKYSLRDTNSQWIPDTMWVGKDSLIRQLVVPSYGISTKYYVTQISSKQWLNVDDLMRAMSGEDIEIRVRLPITYPSKVSVNFVLPDQKIWLSGGLLDKKSKEYGFYTLNGHIPLAKNQRGVIVVVKEQNDKLYYSAVELVTTGRQVIDVRPREATREDINAAIAPYGIRVLTESEMYSNDDYFRNTDDLEQSTEMTTQADVSEFDYLKPKNCTCKPYFIDRATVARKDQILDSLRKIK